MDDASYGMASGIWSLFASLFCCGIYVIPILIGILLTILWLWMLIDVLRRDEKTFSDSNGKLLWILILLLGGTIGAIIYYFMEYGKHK